MTSAELLELMKLMELEYDDEVIQSNPNRVVGELIEVRKSLEGLPPFQRTSVEYSDAKLIYFRMLTVALQQDYALHREIPPQFQGEIPAEARPKWSF